MAVLTVFTPTYNRAHTLPDTYASLCSQKNKDFLWLIVDDGSTDHTAQLVSQWQNQDNGFEIRYLYQENGGMHTAHNTAYAAIDTELNMCIDSDDRLAPDAVDTIVTKWAQIRHLGYAGMIGLDADLHGHVIGTGFSEGLQETTLSGFYAAGGHGDKKLVYRTDVIRKYPPYPVFSGEKYMALAYLYYQIDRKYKLAVVNDVLCLVNYQQDGHSAAMWREYVRSPKGFALWRKLCMEYPLTGTRLWADCLHYVAESLLAGNRHFLRESPRKCRTLLCAIPGWILYHHIKRKAK